MFAGQEISMKSRRRKKRARLSFEAKTAFVIEMMTKNADALTMIRRVSGWGFSMSQIADMTSYERSTALMNDLLRMCDEGSLMLEVRPRLSNGISPIEYWFYTPEEHKRALKQGRLIE